MFQFYDSPIKSLDGRELDIEPYYEGFNSMIVRLKDPQAHRPWA